MTSVPTGLLNSGKQGGGPVLLEKRAPLQRTPRQLEKLQAVFGRRRSAWLAWLERKGFGLSVTKRFAGHRCRLRLGTSDPLVWYSVFLQRDYSAALPFQPRVIVDAGAYTGFSALYFAQRYPESSVLAIEPDPANFRLLEQNVRSCPRVHPIHAALWSRDEKLALFENSDGFWASSVGAFNDNCNPVEAPERRTVRGVSLGTLMIEYELGSVDLLKVDIEGAEKEVFRHSSEWIDSVGAIFVELHDRLIPGCTDAVFSATDGFFRSDAAPLTKLLVNPRFADRSG